VGDKLDRVKFSKVCEMMTSSHEGERLSATARANEMLKAAGMTWTEALKPAPTVDAYKAFKDKYPAYQETPFSSRAEAPFNQPYYQRANARARQTAAKPQKHKGWTPDDFTYSDLAKELEMHECYAELEERHQEFILEMSLNDSRVFSEKQRKYLDGLGKKLAGMLKTRQHTY
jgi:hypothetical protein